MSPPHVTPALFPYTTLFRSPFVNAADSLATSYRRCLGLWPPYPRNARRSVALPQGVALERHPVLQQLPDRSEEHTSELQSRGHLVCRLLLEKKNNIEG